MIFEEISRTDMLKVCRWAKKNKKHGAWLEVEEIQFRGSESKWNVKTSHPNLITDSNGCVHQYSKKKLIDGVWYFSLINDVVSMESLVALRTIDKCLRFYHDNKPPKGSPELRAWESEIVHIRIWAAQIRMKRIAINLNSVVYFNSD